MIQIYRRDQHPGEPLCEECGTLSIYADERFDPCHIGEGKPTCQSCPIHCYQKAQRLRIREIMRYAGPRMVWRHPLLAIRYLIHNKKTPGNL